MALTQSARGHIECFNDFNNRTAVDLDGTGTGAIIPPTGVVALGDLMYVSVNEGSITWTIDEGNGVISLTSDTGDDDNQVLVAGRWLPSVQGPLVCEGRFKHDGAATTFPAVFCGFTETLSLGTPVMPAEFATVTMTYNGTGQMLGAQMDVDGTTDDYRALAGNAGAVQGTNRVTGAALAAAGIRANETLTADEWYIVRVELDESGNGKVYVGHKGRSLDLIGDFTGLSTTNPMYAVLMFENRTAAARICEVDYFGCTGSRDWEVT